MTTLGPRRSWYTGKLPLGRDAGSRAVLVGKAGDFGITIQATGPTDFADLERLVGEATIGSCAGRNGWGPVVP